MSYLKKPALQLLLIMAIALIAYANTFEVPFLFDDETSIALNPVIRDLPSFLGGAGYHYNPRRFVGYLSVALNYSLGRLDVTGYHIFNLAVHICSAWLVYLLVRLTLATPFFELGAQGAGSGRLGRQKRSLLPLLTALFFVAHPVQTQAVTYVIQRLASLATMFFLLSLVLYVKGRLGQQTAGSRRPQRALLLFGASFLCALLAMKTKEIAFTLPLVVLLFESYFFGISRRSWRLLLIPMLLALLVIPLTLLDAGQPLGKLLSDVTERTRLQTDLPRLDYLFTQFRVIVTYLRLLVFPARQNLDYDYPVYHSLFAPPVLLSLLLLLALIALALYLYARSTPGYRHCDPNAGETRPAMRPEARLASFGILWFFITLSVESSLIPIVDLIFEHRLYLPSVGACLVAAAAGSVLIRTYPGKLSGTALISVLLLLTVLSWQRNEVWKDGVTLWSDTAGKSPGKARPHLNLGSELMQVGRTEQAMGQFRWAVKIKPDYGEAYSNLAAAYNTMGMPDEAIEQCRIALRLDPDNADALNNAGTSFAIKGEFGYAISYFQGALQLQPGNPRYSQNLEQAYRDKGAR